MCVYIGALHCTLVESSPRRVIPLLSISSPCRGILFYRYWERARGWLVLKAELEEKPDCGFDDFIHVLEFSNFNTCVV